MSIIFTEDFTDQSLPNWPFQAGNGTKLVGCGGSRCLTCGNNLSLGIRKGFSPIMTDGTIRFHFAYFASDPTSQIVYLPRILQLGNNNYIIELLLYPDGHIQLVSPSNSFDSPTGLIPTNGVWVAIQMTFHLYLLPSVVFPGAIEVRLDFQLIVNNSLMWNIVNLFLVSNNTGPGPRPANWDGIELLAYSVLSAGKYAVSAIDNLTVEDSINVITFNPCTAIPAALYNGVCSYVPTVFSGIYKIINGSNKSHDAIYTSLSPAATTDVAIPTPKVITGLLGDE